MVDVGNELVVRIAGYPAGKARVYKVDDSGVYCHFNGLTYRLPLDFKDYDQVDGVAHSKDCFCHLYDEDERPCSVCRIKIMGA